MRSAHWRHRRFRGGGAVAFALILALGYGASGAAAAGPPLIGTTWASAVSSDSAKVSAQIDPNGFNTTYHFDYITEAAYQANGGTFAGALRSPAASEATLGLNPLPVSRNLAGLAAATTYRYRAVAKNSDPAGSQNGPTRTFTTQPSGVAAGTCSNAPVRAQQFSSYLADCRAYEMVSPVQKNGGQVDPPKGIADGGVLQAASGGRAITYGSTASFGSGQGAPGASQYIATRTASGWATENITAPIAYNSEDGGVPYELFSGDLARALMLNGSHCVGGINGCAVENPPLPGTEAPTGYQDYYLRDNSSGGFEALLGVADVADLDIGPADFDLRFAGASPDLKHVVISTCAALSAGATEIPQGSGCDPSRQNLYEWASGAGLTLLNGGVPGAALAAQSGAVSADGSRVYWRDTASGDLYLHDGAGNHLLATAAVFQAASADGATAFYTKAGSLHSYDATTYTPSSPLASGVVGVLGASISGDTVYFQDAGGLRRWHNATTTQVAPNQASPPANAADAGNYPPATGTARVSSDGTKLLFVSSASLSGYDNASLVTGNPVSQVFLYDATAPALTCVSCNPTNGRPLGPSTVPGAVPNGSAPGSTNSYKPRVLSADGQRVFFDSLDALVLTDTNFNPSTGAGIADAYQWQAQGEGTCSRPRGCIALISSGRSTGGALFVDASADGTDAFFITDDSLVSADPGSLDLYDARAGGGFLVPSPPIPCEGDACQVVPPEPIDPTLTTLLAGRGNPPARYQRLNRQKKTKRCRAGTVKRKGRCVKERRRGGRR